VEQALGKIGVTVPGTLVRVTSVIDLDAGGVRNSIDRFTCHAVLFQAWKANTGYVYVGLANMNKNSGEGVLAVLAVPTVNSIPAFSISLTMSPAGVNLSDIYLDADVAGEGPLVTLLIT
jgi:hypothetical protein